MAICEEEQPLPMSTSGPVPAIKLANKALGVLPKPGLNPDELIDKASKRCGLPPLQDPAMYDGLKALCYSLNNEARLTPIGHFVMKGQILDSLGNRLQVEQWHRQHADLEESITRPLIIVGLPRTGTTLLSNLLDLDPLNRSLYQWQADKLVPPPSLSNYREDPRIAKSVSKINATKWLIPNFQAAHPTQATHPCECIAILEDDFRSIGYDTIARVPSYWHWRDNDDMTSAYRYHKQVLQMLQHTLPTENWCLKTPGHLWALASLKATYPDAVLIFTHRDLAKVIPSAASLARTMRSGFSNYHDPVETGREWLDKVNTAMDRAKAFEEEQGKDAFCHILYEDLVKNPIAAIETIYKAAGREVSDLFKLNINYWMQHPPANEHGKHHYSAGEFGLEAASIRERFTDYHQRYNVPTL